MSSTSTAVQLEHRFADDLPELAVPWQADEAPEPRLLALDDDHATELGLDPGWLRTPSGLAFLTGTQVPTAPGRSRRATPATSSATTRPASATDGPCSWASWAGSTCT